MNLIDLLAAPVVTDLVADAGGQAKRDNKPSWDNWSNSTPSRGTTSRPGTTRASPKSTPPPGFGAAPRPRSRRPGTRT